MKPHIPTRTCIVTRQKRPRNELFRITRIGESPYTIKPDPNQNLGGRGIYLIPEKKIVEKSLIKNKIGFMLKLQRELSEEEKNNIKEKLSQL